MVAMDIVKKIKDLIVILFSADYIYVSRGNDFKGKCPACNFDHSQEGITRYSAMGGFCMLFGIYQTDIECMRSICSGCKRSIKWYEHKKK